MQPVEPSTIVRGPDAFTMSFMTSADSHPWHVRWPDVKYSSMVTFLIPRNGSRIWVWFVNVVASAMPVLLFADAEPERLGLGLSGIRGIVTEVRRLVDVLQGHLATAEAADEREQRRPLLGVVEGGPDLVGHHARVERRAERVIAVDHTDRLRPRQDLDELLRRERPEPAQAHQTDLLALRPQSADTDLHRQRDRPHADQDDLGVVGHVLLEPRVLGAAAEHLAEVGVGFLDHGHGALHGLVVLTADLDDPVLVGLRSHRE